MADTSQFTPKHFTGQVTSAGKALVPLNALGYYAGWMNVAGRSVLNLR